MHSLKVMARGQFQAILRWRQRAAGHLLSDLARQADQRNLRFGVLWSIIFLVYLGKRLFQEALRLRFPWRGEEGQAWRREIGSQFLHKLCRWEENSEPFHPFSLHARNNRLTERDIASMRERMTAFDELPLFSIVVPVHDACAEWLERLYASVESQIYDRWELILVDDGSASEATRRTLERIAVRDERILVEVMDRNEGVVAASNRGCGLANGSFLAFLDHDDELTPDALWHVAERLQRDPDCDLLYSDEELVHADGKAYATFKPDFSPELLTAYNYFCHLLVVRKTVFDAVGRFRRGTDGAQDFDLVLRVIHATHRVAHLPRILYRWHVVPRSMSREIEPKTRGFRPVSAINPVTRDVVQAHLDRFGIPARAVIVDHWARPEFFPADQGKVSIIVCSKDHPFQLWRLVRSIETRTDYPNYEVILVDNGSQSLAARICYRWLSRRHRVLRVENGPEGFNWSRLNNRAAREADGEFLLFLNDDMRVLTRNWLSALVGYSRFPGVGACGGRLLFPDRTVQHAGLIVGTMGWGPWHALRGVPADTNGHGGYVNFPHNCVAVTGACLFTRRELFHEVGGFDEADFAVSFNDVDYCLRLHRRGLRCVFVPQAELIHYEGQSRPGWVLPQEAAALHERYRGIIDPYWNPNFSRNSTHFVVDARRKRRGFVVRGSVPRVLVVAPTAKPGESKPAWESLLHELARRGKCTFVRESRVRGGFPGRLGDRLADHAFDVVFIQGLENWRAVDEAERAGLRSIWYLPDHLSPGTPRSPSACWEFVRALRVLHKPYQVVFNNPYSMAMAYAGRPRENFSVLEGVVLEPFSLPARNRQEAKDWLAEKWDIGHDRLVLVAPADSVHGNGWQSLLEAYVRLGRSIHDRCALLLVGTGEIDYRYARTLRRRLARMGNEVFVSVAPAELGDYIAAADIVISQPTSHFRPEPVLWAMHLGIPVLGTWELARSETLHPGGTGPIIHRFRPAALASALRRWIKDAELRQRDGEQAAYWLRSRSHRDYVLEGWGDLLAEAAELGSAAAVRARVSAPAIDGDGPRSRTFAQSRTGSVQTEAVGSKG